VNRVASTKQWAPHRPSLASSPLLSLCQDLYRGVVRACPGARGQGGSRHDGVARASTRAESPAQPLLNLMADAVSMSRPGRGWGVGGGGGAEGKRQARQEGRSLQASIMLPKKKGKQSKTGDTEEGGGAGASCLLTA
jgi:hypothetical protein